ncbi:MAG: TonB-dependent receptor [Bacteroidales bacterium]|nr:TonB-dependent receptor [Bacteroidales bacterium]
MKILVRNIIVLMNCLYAIASLAQDTMKTVTIDEVVVSGNIKSSGIGDKLPSLTNSFNQQYLNNHNVTDFKDFSSVAPTLYIPDYGSSITSSIYIRGIGSRIDNSSVGICLDGVMLLNKNCFDFRYFDFSKVDILKGSSSLLFGMNTMAGLINITTLSPFDYQGLKASIGYASANTLDLKLSYYALLSENKAFMFGIDAQRTDGYFENKYNKENVDWSKSLNARMIYEYRGKNNLSVKNSTYVSLIHQGGYAYRQIDTNTFEVDEVNYNDKSGYDRVNIINNTSILKRKKNVFSFQSLTSVQLNFDKMTLDNDFTQDSYFTLQQKEKDYAFSQEFVFKNDNKISDFDWTIGTFFFYKHLDMNAPVLFKKDGIQRLILDNINNGMHSAFPLTDEMIFRDDTMLVSSGFKYPRMGMALYSQLSYNISDKLQLIGGLRYDLERVALDYDCYTNVFYRFTGTMADYSFLRTTLSGKDHKYNYALLPKLSVLYKIEGGNIFASVSRGYMTGGYNTQMFADLIQNQMKQNMLNDMGLLAVDGTAMADIYANYDRNNIINYQPEYMWNYEVGTHLRFFDNKLKADISLYYMNISNQQLTIFLTPYTNGRMMDNASSSSSLGAEVSLTAKIKRLTLILGYGYSKATFNEYNDNKEDYKNKYMPYYPLNTLSVCADYYWLMDSKYLDMIDLCLTYQGLGRIYFNQQNTLYQKYYNLLSLDLTLKRNRYSVSFWARNLLNTKYNTFYFLSTGHNFVQRGKPLRIGITLRYSM